MGVSDDVLVGAGVGVKAGSGALVGAGMGVKVGAASGALVGSGVLVGAGVDVGVLVGNTTAATRGGKSGEEPPDWDAMMTAKTTRIIAPNPTATIRGIRLRGFGGAGFGDGRTLGSWLAWIGGMDAARGASGATCPSMPASAFASSPGVR